MKYNSLFFILILTMVSCSAPKARKPVARTTSTVMKASVDNSKKIFKQEEAFFRKLMAEDSLQTYHKSKRGFWYAYKKRDTINTYQLVKGDEVTYTYDINDIFGNQIYSEEEIGIKKYYVDEEVIMQGLQEGLKLLKAHEEVTFLFPSYKAYGFTGNNDRIGVNTPLICNVKIVTINPKINK